MLSRPLPKMPDRYHALRRSSPAQRPIPHFRAEIWMQMNDANDAGMPPAPAGMALLAAADLQDHLMSATNDLERLQTLLADACDTLMQRFYGASEQIRTLRDRPHSGEESDQVFSGVMQDLGGAVTALQFQDMASQ